MNRTEAEDKPILVFYNCNIIFADSVNQNADSSVQGMDGIDDGDIVE